jgi:hypothetical protein
MISYRPHKVVCSEKIEPVVRIAANIVGVTKHDIIGQSRESCVVAARHLAMWAGVRVLGQSAARTGKSMARMRAEMETDDLMQKAKALEAKTRAERSVADAIYKQARQRASFDLRKAQRSAACESGGWTLEQLEQMNENFSRAMARAMREEQMHAAI